MSFQKLREQIAYFYQSYCGDDMDALMMRTYDGDPTVRVSLTDLAIFSEDILKDLLENPETLLPQFEQTLHNYGDLIQSAFESGDLNVSPVSVTPYQAPAEADMTDAAASEEPLIPPESEIVFTEPTADVNHDIGAPRDNKIGQMVAFEGICKQVSDNKPRVVETVFRCDRCGTKTDRIDISDTFELQNALPHECTGCDRQGPFERVQDEEKREEYQQLRVQEPPGEAINEASPREVVWDVMGEHLIDTAEPGNRVTVVGILREFGDNDSTLLDTRLDVISVIPEEVQFEEVEFDESDVDDIEEIAASPDVFEHVTNSVAPSIYGNEEAKLAVALQMFGGVSRTVHGNRKRGEIHIMFIGDPGVGKSQILESARSLSPRSVSSSGTGSSAVGLTASAQKEKIGGQEEWTLQAGSLVLADGGMITIDELDNMGFNEQQSLDEALSEGQISVDKANVHANLNARCSALMAANPEQGRFDPYEPLAEQFDMPKELLDRCDLVFPFRDTPDEDLDEAIVDTILDTHTPDAAAADGGVEAVEDRGYIDPDLFRKYVAYARRNYDPNLTDAAMDELKQWYMSIRGTSDDGQISINTRMFEGAIRLSQASARARLSETVDSCDAERAIELVMSMLNALGMDREGGGYDVDMINRGAPSKTQQQIRDDIKMVVDELAAESDGYEGAKRADILERMDDRLGYDKDRVDGEIDKLCTKGEMYTPEEGSYQVT
jgi:replicative DNA helicase Mcm